MDRRLVGPTTAPLTTRAITHEKGSSAAHVTASLSQKPAILRWIKGFRGWDCNMRRADGGAKPGLLCKTKANPTAEPI
jgi:hypothetical protein